VFQLLILEEVGDEIEEAYNWYEEQREGLGEELLIEIGKSYKKLSEHPQYYSYSSKKFRRIKIDRFPYFLIYGIEKDAVIINSFIHAKRKRNGN
jgi:toxin ParE1/3/4